MLTHCATFPQNELRRREVVREHSVEVIGFSDEGEAVHERGVDATYRLNEREHLRADGRPQLLSTVAQHLLLGPRDTLVSERTWAARETNRDRTEGRSSPSRRASRRRP